MRTRDVILPAIVLGFALSAGCRGAHEGERDRAILAIARNATGSNASAGVSSLPQLDGTAYVPAHASPGVPDFFVVAREPHLSKAPCASCHTVPMTSMKQAGAGAPPRAHWTIELRHAPPSVMTCATCHENSVEPGLHTLTGQPIAFNHAYELCAQCHSRQKADWEGGAHGKRRGGWAPPRVVEACTGCHNPHQPRLDTRWPARAGRTDK